MPSQALGKLDEGVESRWAGPKSKGMVKAYSSGTNRKAACESKCSDEDHYSVGSNPTGATNYWGRGMGIGTYMRMPRLSQYTISDDDFIDAVKTSISIREALTKMGFSPAGGNYKVFHLRAKRLGIDTSHFLGQGHLKGKSHSWSPKIPLEELLVQDSDRALSQLHKKRIIREGLLVEQCQSCGLQNEWDGKPLVLHLDHINGDHFDNRIENLRLLCPNCHSQTPTYCSKNVKINGVQIRPSQYPKQEKEVRLCLSCSKPLKDGNSTYCRDCYNSKRTELQSQFEHKTKIVWPPVEELLSRLQNSNYLQLSKELGVSDNAIRKHLKAGGVDPPKMLNAKRK